MPVRVLMISDVYFPRVNGVATSIRTFREDLGHLGCETWLVAPVYPSSSEDDPKILRQPSRYLFFDPEDRLMQTGAAFAACRELQGRFDLVHIQTPFVAHRLGLRVSRMAGVKVLETYHTFFEEYLHHYLPFVPRTITRALARTISRRQCNGVDRVIVPSKTIARVLEQYGVDTRIDVIPTGLDMRDFAGGDGRRFREKFGIPARRPVLLLVGRVAYEKNIEFILEALAAVRASISDVLLVIAGEGPALGMLRRRVESAGLANHVMFVGYLDRRGSLLDCYRAADVFVFASRTETQGLVLLEALALGVPVVSTAVLGTKEVLENAPGTVIVEENVVAFASAVIGLLEAPERRVALAREARDFVATRWSSAEMARRLASVYRELLNA
jgi:1,2-diacylglycerol 3-alpha-glucosyltransferase